MNDTWIKVLSFALVGLGILAEMNLLRIFVGDWLKGRREQSRTPVWPRPRLRRRPSPPASREHRWFQRAVAALFIALAPTVARAASDGSAPLPAELSLSFQPAAPAVADAKPLTISTDRPGFSDTTGISALGHLQLETGYTFTFRKRDGVESQTHNAPELLARVGIIEDRLELRVGTSGYVWSRSDTGPAGEFESVAGFSDMFVGFKLKLFDQDGTIPRLALEAITTVGTGSRAMSNRDLEPTVKLLASWDLGSGFTLTSNAVLTYATTSDERFLQGAGSASLGYSATDSLSLFLEYFVVGPHYKGTDAAHSIDFGGAYLLNNRVQLDARIGFGLNREADNVFAGVGISFLF